MKKITLSVLPLVTILAGCNQQPYGYITTSKEFVDADKAATFIVECAAAANPLSDEEGEDLVAECKYTARDLYGVFKFVAKVTSSGALPREVCRGDTYQIARDCFKEQFPLLEIK